MVFSLLAVELMELLTSLVMLVIMMSAATLTSTLAQPKDWASSKLQAWPLVLLLVSYMPLVKLRPRYPLRLVRGSTREKKNTTTR